MTRASDLARAAALAWACCVLSATDVAAQPQSTHSEPEKDTARELYRLGNERYANGDFRGALEAFEGAHRIMNVATTGLGLGRTQAKLGLLIEARDTLARVTSQTPSKDDPDAFVDARKEARELGVEVGRRIASLSVIVTTVDGVVVEPRVTVDGAALTGELRQVPRELNPGTHVVQASADGYLATAQSLQLGEGEKRTLQLMLAKIPPAPAPEPVVSPDPPPVVPEPQPDVESTDTTPLWLMVVGFSTAGVGAIAGAVSGAVSLSAASDLEAVCDAEKSCPSSADATRSLSLTTAHVSTVSFALAGVGLAIGIVGVVLLPGDEKGAASLRLDIGPGYVGVRGAL